MSKQKRKSRRGNPNVTPGHRGDHPLVVDWEHAEHPDVDRARDRNMKARDLYKIVDPW